MDCVYSYSLPENTSICETVKRPEPLSGGTKINSFKIDVNHFKKIEENFINKMKEYTFKPLWNPHTEDTISKNVKKPNKTRKIRN